MICLRNANWVKFNLFFIGILVMTLIQFLPFQRIRLGIRKCLFCMLVKKGDYPCLLMIRFKDWKKLGSMQGVSLWVKEYYFFWKKSGKSEILSAPIHLVLSSSWSKILTLKFSLMPMLLVPAGLRIDSSLLVRLIFHPFLREWKTSFFIYSYCQ